jgi:hypothetical protein
MATVSYPKVPAKAWSMLRARAAAAPSIKFTPGMVASLLDMASPDSARDNIVSPFRKLGLIDEEGALTGRGNKWRVDATYAEACQDIIDEVYPGELAGLTDDQGIPDTPKIVTWMQHTGLGASNARQMATTYALIAQKKLPGSPQNSQPKKNPQSTLPKKTPRKKATKEEPTRAVEITPSPTVEPTPSTGNGPNIHLDIQIHIPIDASSEQIDQIFASMARHLYQK